MNEQLQEALAKLLSNANNSIDTAGEFLASELPDVIQQLLMWYGVYNAVICMIGVILLPMMVYVDFRVGNKIKEFGINSDAFVIGYCTAGTIVRLLYLFPISMLNLTWLQIWLAPKVWVLEYASKLAG